MFRIAVMVFLMWGCLGGLVSIIRGIYFWGWGREHGFPGYYAKAGKLSLGLGLLELTAFVGLLLWFLNNEAWAWEHWYSICWIVVPLAIPYYVYGYWDKRWLREGAERHPPSDS